MLQNQWNTTSHLISCADLYICESDKQICFLSNKDELFIFTLWVIWNMFTNCTGKNHGKIPGENLYFSPNVLKMSIFSQRRIFSRWNLRKKTPHFEIFLEKIYIFPIFFSLCYLKNQRILFYIDFLFIYIFKVAYNRIFMTTNHMFFYEFVELLTDFTFWDKKCYIAQSFG